MKNFLLKISENDRKNILDKHKSLYDGYAVKQTVSNSQPLYVQDFANDKNGITVNSNGQVSKYNNKIYMREEKNVCSECGMYEEVCECGRGGMYETECKECGAPMNEGKCSNCGYKQVGKFEKNPHFDYVEEDEKSDKILNKLTDKLEDDLFDDNEITEDLGKLKKGIKKFGRGAMGVAAGIAGIPSYDHYDDEGNWKKDKEGEDYSMFDYSTSQGADIENDFDSTEMDEKECDECKGMYEDEWKETVEFEEDIDKIEESIQESLVWFRKFKKYN